MEEALVVDVDPVALVDVEEEEAGDNGFHSRK
jgi:hypothetical protein